MVQNVRRTFLTMIKIKEIAFTGYPVTDIARSRAFYEEILGLKQSVAFEHEGRSWIEYDVGSTTLAISNLSDQWKPCSDGPSIAFEVENFDAAVGVLRLKGVRFLLEPMTSPSCSLAVVADPDGNGVTIHKRA